MHVAMIGEVNDVRIFGEAAFIERFADTADIPIEVFDHPVVA